VLPALLVGLLIAAYWARVMRLAYKARRRTGRAANLIPTEPLGRLLRVVWFPTVFAWIAFPIVTFFRHKLPPPLHPLYDSRAVAWCALFVACAAFVATLVCWKRMGKSWRMGIDPGEKTQLVVTGPYAFVRHPIYALSCLLMLCTLAIVPSPVMAIVALTHVLLLLWESHREERYLISVHGHLYQYYALRVGRFVPTLFRRHIQSP
jgi:protein-S-isoprenylcysteine O-methyltransferase Ste14